LEDFSESEGSKQALGLMNRQGRIEVQENHEDDENFDFSNFNPDDMLTNKQTSELSNKINFSIPPDEDFLYNNTLWPETSKLYGHGYEIISIAVSHDGTIIASGGKSQSEKHSKLFLWDAEKNSLIKKLEGHMLTIVQIDFSSNDNYILTVSRDRSFCIFEKIENDKDYKLVQIEKETHGRIIWGCCWSKDSIFFLTGSRDKYLKIWKKNTKHKSKDSSIKPFYEAFAYEFQEAITSVNLLNEKIKDNYVGFIGLENGDIYLFRFNFFEEKEVLNFYIVEKFSDYISHGMNVKRIKSYLDEDIIKIATCSDDHTVRIFELKTSYIENLIK